VRGAIYPYEYYGTFGHLQYGQALALQTNPYMTHLSRVPAGNPTVTWSIGTPSWTAGSPHYGQLPINYTVSDPDGLGSLILQKDGDQTGEVDLSGTSATGTLYTPYFAAGQSQEFALMAYDANANRTRVTRTLVVPAMPAGASAGVQPFIRTGSGTVRVGEPLDLDASSSFGLQSGRVNVEWDYEGDGTYDSPVGAQYARWQANYNTPGDYLVRARFTHQLTGAVVESAPIPVRVLPAEPAPAAVEGRVYQDLNGDARRDPFDLPAAGAHVFADSDLDGTYDDGEPMALTDATGRYRIDGMPHGVHVMRVAVPEGYARTAPTALFGGQAVTLFEGKTVDGLEFGLKETTRPQFVSATLAQDAPGDATAPHRLALQFDEDVSRSLAAGDLSLKDSFSGAVVAPSEMAMSFEDGGQRAVVTFPGRPNGRLPAGTWQLSVGAASVTDRAGNALVAPVAQDLAVNSAVAARHLFYNNSAFDLQDPNAGPSDDAALAGKTPLLAAPGAAGARVAVLGTSSFDNLSSYARGINGVMIDVGGAPRLRQWTARRLRLPRRPRRRSRGVGTGPRPRRDHSPPRRRRRRDRPHQPRLARRRDPQRLAPSHCPRHGRHGPVGPGRVLLRQPRRRDRRPRRRGRRRVRAGPVAHAPELLRRRRVGSERL
jgi:hypothetical protein